MQKITRLITITLLAALVLGFVSTAQAADPFEPTYASDTVVDGNPGEWDLTGDFFANMYRAWNDEKDVLNKAYLRYNIETSTLFVLVLTEPGVIIDPSPDDSVETWVKINGDEKVSDSSDSTVFRYIYNAGGDPIGWEASFKLDKGTYTIEIHNNVWDGEDWTENQTSGTIKAGLTIFVVPEYFLGGLVAIGACFAALFAFKKLPTIKSHL